MAVIFACDRCDSHFTREQMDKHTEVHKISVDIEKEHNSKYLWIVCDDCLSAIGRYINGEFDEAIINYSTRKED